MTPDINYQNLPTQEGYKVDVRKLAGFVDKDFDKSSEEDDEPLIDIGTRTFGSNEMHIAYIEGKEGSVLPWHTHTPIMYQVYIPLEGNIAVNYKDNDGEIHRTEAGPDEHVYLPPGAHNKIEMLGPERSRALVIERETAIPRVEHLVGDPDALYDPHDDPEYGLEIDTLRGAVLQKDDEAVEEY